MAGPPRLHDWRDPALLAVAGVVVAAGFAQFGAVAALGDVAEHFGEVTDGDEVAQQVGLSATAIGIGLAVIRLASLGALPLASLADRFGRRRTILVLCAAGLVATMAAAGSPTYWWFVVIFALGRPFLTATDAIGTVTAAEQTSSADRSKAIALVAAAYALGSGLIAVVRGVGHETLGFRGVFLLAGVPLLVLLWLQTRLTEPDRYRSVSEAPERPVPVIGAVRRELRGRLAVIVTISFGIALITGPANSYIFVYGENVLGLSPAVTAGMVVAAGPVGLLGLLLGRWAADALGRRAGGALSIVGMAIAFGITYSGSPATFIGGYLFAILAGGAHAPSFGAIAAELFPTDTRATVGGWIMAGGVLGAVTGLMAFGALSDAFDAFAPSAITIAVPAALVAGVFFLVPETRGRDLEELEREGAFDTR